MHRSRTLPSGPLILLLLLLLGVLSGVPARTHGVDLSRKEDGRCRRVEPPLTQYEDVEPWLSSFSFPGAEGYSQLSLYPPRAQLLVGARNHLFRLNLSSLAVVQSVEWRSDEATIRACISKGRSVDECQNYPKVLLVRGKHVFACGTNAFSPVCARRQAEDLSVTHERVSGVARCPYDPRHHSAALLTPRGELYAATVMDFSGRDPAIYRSLGGLPPLRTAQYNSRWLHDPSFVSVYDIGHFAYFFFRERAVGEATECPNGAGGGIGGAGGGVVSRVARVCKNDQGGRYLLEGTWTTFSKARLDCSSPGEAVGGGGGGGGGGVATTYEHLRSTFYLPEQDLVYAVLSTRVSSIEVSAVCSFNLTAIQRAFSGPFAYQEHPRGPWSHRPNPDPNFQCGTASGEEEEEEEGEEEPEEKSARAAWTSGGVGNLGGGAGGGAGGGGRRGTGVSLEDRHKQVLMQGVVRSATGTPLYAHGPGRLSHLAVDIVQGKEALYHVMYLATDTGTIRKVLASGHGDLRGCVLEELRLSSSDARGGDDDGGGGGGGSWDAAWDEGPRGHEADGPHGGPELLVRSLLIVQEERALYVGLRSRVLRIPLERCHVHATRGACVSARDPYCGWDVRQQRCTTIERSISMSLWMQDISRCPTRNQTVDGGFGAWTPWRGCEHADGSGGGGHCSCRTRACDRPAPRCGGRACEGARTQVANCSRSGGWSPWAPWSECSATCGGGAQRRTRACSNPTPRHGGRACEGQSYEERLCNERTPCPPVVSWSHWGIWSDCTKPCDGGFQVRRRICLHGSHCPGCDVSHRACNEEPCGEARAHTPWTPWATYNASGDGGGDRGGGGVGPVGARWERRFRFTCRARGVPTPDGVHVGHARSETRYCPAGLPDACPPDHGATDSRSPPQGPATAPWAPWAAWSPCSVSCGRGFRVHRRACLQPDSWVKGQAACAGSPEEYEECEEKPCQGRSFWCSWGPWSPCSPSCGAGRRERSRTCEGDHCVGERVQREDCNNHTCPEASWSQWGPWGACDMVRRRQARARSCPGERLSGTRCAGNATETRACGATAVPPSATEFDAAVNDAQCGGGFGTVELLAVGAGCGLASALLTLAAHAVWSALRPGCRGGRSEPAGAHPQKNPALMRTMSRGGRTARGSSTASPSSSSSTSSTSCRSAEVLKALNKLNAEADEKERASYVERHHTMQAFTDDYHSCTSLYQQS
ncbi:unnamed protein product [Lampetra planeri]